jgi:LPXTG-motif cell wall-anchored protein
MTNNLPALANQMPCDKASAEWSTEVFRGDISMKPLSNVLKNSRAAVVALSGVALALSLAAPGAQADQWNKRTTLTIDQPMQVTDTYLEPGQYVFKLLDSQSDRHIVQIYNADQTHLITTILAIPDYRVQVTGSSRFTMWETPAGYVGALKSWYYPGDSFGQEFRYPKHLREIQVAQVTTTQAQTADVVPAPAPQEEQSQVVQQQEDNVIAQNAPPPPPPAVAEQPAPAPEPAPAPAPAVLPKTATAYPLIGFIGVLLLGLGGLLRRTRSA